MKVAHFTAITDSFKDCKKGLKYARIPECSITLIQNIANKIGSIGLQEEEEIFNKGLTNAEKLGESKQNNIFATFMDGGRCKVWQNEEKLADSQWKEVKMGGFCDYYHIQNKKNETELSRHWTKYMGRVQEDYLIFGEHLLIEAVRRGYYNSRIKVFLGDGDKKNWEVHNMFFHDSIPILDWYHAVEHLALIGKLIFGENSPLWPPWFEECKNILYEGDWEWLLQKIDCHLNKMKEGEVKNKLSTERGYFYRNRLRINYAEYEKSGLPIGSGIIESGIKITVNKRLKGTEKHWRKIRSNNILKLKVEEESDCQQFLYQLYLNTLIN